MIPLFPLGQVVFPGMPLQLRIFEPRYRLMVRRCVRDNRPFGVVLITKGSDTDPNAEFFPIGCTARIKHVERYQDGPFRIDCVGEQRFRILEVNREETYMQGKVEVIPEQPGDDGPTLDALTERALKLLSDYLELVTGSDQLRDNLLEKEFTPQALSYTIAILLRSVPQAIKQEILERPSTTERLQHEIAVLQSEITGLQLAGEKSLRYDPAMPQLWSLN